MKYFLIAASVAVLSTIYTPKAEAAMEHDWCQLMRVASQEYIDAVNAYIVAPTIENYDAVNESGSFYNYTLERCTGG
jgi:hypothetical protein